MVKHRAPNTKDAGSNPARRAICIKCNEEKVIETFVFKEGSYRNECKPCLNARKRKRYYEHDRIRKTYARRNKQLKSKRQEDWKPKLLEIFKTGCSRCEEKDLRCLEFHHLDPSKKKHTVTGLITGKYSDKTIQEEIEKCIVLCSNCHRKETFSDPKGHWLLK